jgi:hyperosmotically inducible periplasmic protein
MNTKSLVTAILIGSAVAMGSVGCSHMGDKSAGAMIDDTTITTKVKAKFVDDPVVKALDIKVNTYEGVVQLSGFANSLNEIDQAGRIARSTSGVKSVKNDIRLASK